MMSTYRFNVPNWTNQKEHSDLGKRMEKSQIAVLNKALSDQRVLCAQKI
jgi:hypothetical protein